MTESDWLSRDWHQMLGYLDEHQIGSDRRWRLLGCGVARSMWDMTTEPVCREAVHAAEQWADGEITAAVAEQIQESASMVAWPNPQEAAPYTADLVASETIRLDTGADAMWYGAWLCGMAWEAIAALDRPTYEVRLPRWKRETAAIITDIFGAILSSAKPLASGLLAQNDRRIMLLGQAAYDGRILPSGHLDLTRLAVLADALEEADCDNADILSHLRGPGPHVRGCWVVDLLTGRA
jgi:hypothetical protein